MPLPLLSPWPPLTLYIQLKHHHLQEALLSSHPFQAGEVSLCSGLPQNSELMLAPTVLYSDFSFCPLHEPGSALKVEPVSC